MQAMYDISELDDLVDGPDEGYNGYLREVDDLIPPFDYGNEYDDPDWYMDMPDSIRGEFESADRYTTD